MAYKELKKLYYGDQEIYRETYMQRFSSDNTVRLGFDIAGYQAFFVQCDDVINLTYQILKLDKDIYKLRVKLPEVALEQYSKRCLIDEIVITNNIEGVYSSRKEIGAALSILEEQSIRKGKKPAFLGLVNKYKKLLSHDEVPLQTCQDIRDIYDEIVLEEVVSENKHHAPDGQIFRKDMTEVYAATGKSVHKGKYPEAEIITYMEKALSFLNDDEILPAYRICLFHYMIEYIHPFYDGNGRVGRLLALKMCLANDIVPFFINDDSKIFYYKGLKEWQVDGKKERLLDVFLSMQDDMKCILDYFEIAYDKSETRARDLIQKHNT